MIPPCRPPCQMSTPQRYPTSVSSCCPLAFFVPTLRTTARSSNSASGSYLDSNTPYTISNQGWMTVETLFIHINTSFAPSGHFPVYSDEWLLVGENGTEVMSSFQIGHDAAVCVQIYEPWIVEAYNTSTGSSFALGIVEKGNGSTSLSSSGSIRGAQITDTRYLNTTGKDVAFSKAHSKSVRRMAEANYDQGAGRFGFGVPSPIVGPVLPLRTIFLLISTNSTGRFFHQWHWAQGIYRTFSRPVRRYPRTGQCGGRSTIPRRVGTHRRTIVWG